MKLLLVLAVICAVAFADVEIVNQVSAIEDDGSYKYAYELSDGSVASQEGAVGGAVHGSVRYTSPEGTPIVLTYTADENGYQPVGDHLPVGPEVPAYITKSLEYIRAHPPKE